MLAQRLGHESEDARLGAPLTHIATNHGRDMIDANDSGCLEPVSKLRGIGRYIDARETATRIQLVRNQSDRQCLILSDDRADGRSTAGLAHKGEPGKATIAASEHPAPIAVVKDRADQLPSVRAEGCCIQLTNSLEIGD
jgi:hypothetical protein